MRDEEVILTGERKDDTLYQLDFQPELQTTETIYAHVCSDLFQDTALGADMRASLITWHRRLGHIGYHTLVKMIRQDLVAGLNIAGECKIPETLCSDCELAKFTRLPLKVGRHRASRIGELTHSDVWGPIATPSLGGARYFVSFKDDFSGFLTIYFMKKKNEVPALIRLYHAMLLNETGFYMLTLRTDNGRAEYDNHEADKFLAEAGIRHETSAPYTPAQNGTAERVNRTLLNSVRAMLISSGLPPSMWGEAISYSVYIRNRVLSRTNDTTPYALWNNRQPDVSAIRIFGSRAFIRDPTPSSKLEARSLEGVFVGRCISQNASRVYIPETRKVLISKDVKIDETILYRDMTKDLPILTVNIQIHFVIGIMQTLYFFFFFSSLHPTE